MTIEELKTRKRELVQQRKMLEASGADPLEVQIIKEEILDVNSQLRIFTNHTPRALRPYGNRRHAPELHAYHKWRLEQNNDEEELSEQRTQLVQASIKATRKLTPRQFEIFQMAYGGGGEGLSPSEIARQLSINPSSVSITLKRAKKRLQAEAEAYLFRERCGQKEYVVDLSDTAIAEQVMGVLTPKQAVLLYLYYSEWMSLRQIGRLIDVDPSCVSRTIHRALYRIGLLFDGESTVLSNMDALDELAFQVYSEMSQSLQTATPQELYKKKRYNPSARTYVSDERTTLRSAPDLTLRHSSGRTGYAQVIRPHKKRTGVGKLLTALYERSKALLDRPEGGRRAVYSWLASVFKALIQRKKPASFRRRSI